MEQNFYDKKIIVLDLNLLEIEQRTIDDQIYTKKLLWELTANQNVIITTDNSCFEAIPKIEKLGLKAGYLVSNAGATITNISNQKTINAGTIDPDIALQICNLCVWNNLHFSIVTDDSRYPFNLNYWLIKKYKTDLSYLYKYKSNTIYMTPEIKEILKQFPIRKIEVYFLQRDLERRKKEMIKLISSFEKHIDYSINASTLQILPKGKTKLNAIQMVIKTLELDSDLRKDGIYVAVDQFDCETIKNIYFPLIRYELTDDIQADEMNGAEILPMGGIAWIKWFYNHEHLWNGDTTGKIKRSLDKYKDHTILSHSLIALQNGKTKWISIEKTSKNEAVVEKAQLSFWPQQVPQVISVLKEYSWSERKN